MRNPTVHSNLYLEERDEFDFASETKPLRPWLRLRPSTRAACALFLCLGAAVTFNALYMQDMKHAAPLFASTAYSPPPQTAPSNSIAIAVASPSAGAAQTAPPTGAPRAAPDAGASIPSSATGSTASSIPARPQQAAHAPSDLIAREIARINAPPPASVLDRAHGGENAQHAPTASIPPVRRAAAAEPAPVKRDAIANLISGGGARSKLETDSAVLAAQRALIKLGYVVRPSGVLDETTHAALQQFADENDLPLQGGLSPRLKQELARQSGLTAQ